MLLADIATLFYATIATSLVLALALGVISIRRDMKPLRLWAAALLLYAVCYVLLRMHDEFPSRLAITGANVAVSGFIALWASALARLQGASIRQASIYVPVALVALAVFTFADEPRLRIGISNTIFLLQLGQIVHLLVTLREPADSAGRRLLLAATAVSALMLLARVVAAVTETDQLGDVTTRSVVQTITYLVAMAMPVIGSLGFLLMMKERADRQIEEGKHVLTTIIDSSEESIAMFHRDGTLLAINRKGAERFHTLPEKMIGWHMADVMPPDVSGPRIAAIRRVADTGTSESLVDQRAGRTFRLTFYPIQGETERVVAYGADITETLAAEEALRRSEAHFRAFFERSMVGMATTSPSKGWIEVNQALCDILGYPREELLQKTWTELTHPDDVMVDVANFDRVVSGETEEYARDKRFIRKDGALTHVHIAARCVRLPNGGIDYFVVLVQDINERKRHERETAAALARLRELNAKLTEAQNQLLQSEKMASIGQLAAGVAHELNNPIGFVSSNLGSLEDYLQDIFAIIAAYEEAEAAVGDQCPQLDTVRALKDNKNFDYLRSDIVQLMTESKDGLARVAKIVRDLKDFSRAGDATFRWADLHQGIDSTLNVVWNELKYKCTVKKDYGELPQVWCVLSQLNQVFMNLLVNAAHAIPDKGEITLRTGRTGDEVFVAVADTGIGIAPENINRVFEPFFTTKPVGKGTGLGLSLAYSIVQKHQGHIEVQSEPGKGTTFTVWLPIEGKGALDAASAVPPAPTSTGFTSTPTS
jgi:PAS domain S-box-containing protein